MNELESILTDLPPPTVGEEHQDRQRQLEKLWALFKAKPLIEIEADELTRLVGPNYRSRIADLRKMNNMDIIVIRRHVEDAKGRKHAALGAYLFRPYKPLGRDAGTRVGTQQELFR